MQIMLQQNGKSTLQYVLQIHSTHQNSPLKPTSKLQYLTGQLSTLKQFSFIKLQTTIRTFEQ